MNRLAALGLCLAAAASPSIALAHDASQAERGPQADTLRLLG